MNLRICDTDPRILTTDDVIEASHVVVRPKCLPLRVVLRYLGENSGRSEYVVHTETLEVSRRPEDETKSIALRHRSFEKGYYCTDKAKALVQLEERASRL
jgi:hypothetical protein